jgi:hypothetical protein
MADEVAGRAILNPVGTDLAVRLLALRGVLGGQRRADVGTPCDWNGLDDSELHLRACMSIFRLLTVSMLLVPTGALASLEFISQELTGSGLKVGPGYVEVARALAQALRAAPIDRRRGERPYTRWRAEVDCPSIVFRLLVEQNYRCAMCGTDLIHGAQGYELDHVLPWRFFRPDTYVDGANWRFLCTACNQAKSDLPDWHLLPSAADWNYREDAGRLSPWDSTKGASMLAYAVLSRDRTCERCQGSARDGRLLVAPRGTSVSFTMDNFAIYCSDCVRKVSPTGLT